MKNRRKSRELALQMLYSLHTNKKPLNDLFADTVFEKTALALRNYATFLVEGCLKHQSEFTQIISKLSKNWRLKRIAVIDLVILKMALFEINYCEDVPAPVAINEAIELSKKYSAIDAGKFINGILDHYYKGLNEEAE